MYSSEPIRTSDYSLGSNACPSNCRIKPLRRRIVALASLLVRLAPLYLYGGLQGPGRCSTSSLGLTFYCWPMRYRLVVQGVKFPGREACI
jgi:hypothetical protein